MGEQGLARRARRSTAGVLLAGSLLLVAWAAPAQAPGAELPPLVLEDFESVALGGRPFLWKEPRATGVEAALGVERIELAGVPTNKALKIEYRFTGAFAADHGVEAGPPGQALPGSVTALAADLHGDGGRNALALRLRDRQRESFEWRVPVTWTGWRRVTVPLDPAAAVRSGTRQNGVPDPPLVFEAIRLVRMPNGAARGEIYLDRLTAVCRFGEPQLLYDPAAGAMPEAWRTQKNRATVGSVAETTVPRGGRDLPALKLEYEYENAPDSSVEYIRRMPLCDGHGTLVVELFGDGSNNLLRFRLLDAEGRLWQATWAGVLVDWSGWKALYLDTRTLRDPEGADPEATPGKLPLQFHSLVIDDCSAGDNLPGIESGRKGELYLGRIFFAPEK